MDIGKTALVLSGGGAFGAYEVGVIKALYQGASRSTGSLPLNADIFTGTSVGNFNAAVMTQETGGGLPAVERLQHIWLNDVADNGGGNGVYRIRGNPSGYLDPLLGGNPLKPIKRATEDADFFTHDIERRARHFLRSNENLGHRALGLFDLSSFISVVPFEELVRKSINPGVIRTSPKTLRVVATNWETGEMDDFENIRNMPDDEIWQAILASAAIPGVFPPVKVAPHLYVDGGVVMNTPISAAVQEGASFIHIVSLNPELSNADPEVMALRREHLTNTFDTFDRVYAAMLATKIKEDIATAKWINQGLEALERAAAGEELDSDAGRQFSRVAGQFYEKLKKTGQLHRKLQIHHYFPKAPLGGMLGMLNFSRKSIDTMIDRGYKDACAHNCETCGCLLPVHAPQRSTASAGSVS